MDWMHYEESFRYIYSVYCFLSHKHFLNINITWYLPNGSLEDCLIQSSNILQLIWKIQLRMTAEILKWIMVLVFVSSGLMHDPQVAADGFTYKGEALCGWPENCR
ncbi:hypothetical protein Tsubulata_026315 [Turnera subulata]|uniref:Uncharacterized protein n=1 Tax=Turnera subulata TaxID=218843 RepID=A0A9Q0G8A7_9ROSI|nr:hypothetical protein Tsubulata_026315 [Turnera subulata]